MLSEVRRPYISELERGTRKPTIAVVERLARGLDAKMGTLLD